MPLALIVIIGIMAVGAILAVSPGARAAAAAIVAQMGIWLIWAAQHAAPEIAAEVTTAVAATLETLRPTLQAMIAVMLREVAGVGPSATEALTAEGGEFLRGRADAILRRVVSEIREKIAPDQDITAASGIDRANDLVATILTAGMEVWVAELAVDLLSLGKFGAVVSFHDAVIGGLGLQRMIRLIWRAPINEAITKPMTEHYLRTYMQTRPTAAEAIEGWQRGVWSDENVLDLLRNHGYSYEVASALLNVREKRLSTAEGLDLWKAEKIDEETFRRIVKEQGYGEVRTDLVLAREKDAETRTLLRGIADTARRLFKTGDISEDELREYLREARFTDSEISLVMAAEQLALREEKALPVATLLDAYREGALDDQQLRAALTKQHYTAADADLLIATHGRKLSSAQIVEAFARGRIDRDQATDRLTKQGYRVEDIPVLLDLRARDLTEGQILDALRENLINVQTAREKMQRLGLTDETIDVLLAFQRKVLSPAEVQAAVLRGLVAPDAARARLVEAGYSREDADLIVDLRVRLLTVGQILDAYAEDFLDRPETLGDLTARGVAPEDAEILVSKFDAKQAAAAARRAAAGQRGTRRPPAPPAPPA